MAFGFSRYGLSRIAVGDRPSKIRKIRGQTQQDSKITWGLSPLAFVRPVTYTRNMYESTDHGAMGKLEWRLRNYDKDMRSRMTSPARLSAL